MAGDGRPMDKEIKLDGYFADLDDMLDKLADIFRDLAYEEDFDEREGLSRVGIDFVYKARSDTKSMKRIMNRTDKTEEEEEE